MADCILEVGGRDCEWPDHNFGILLRVTNITFFVFVNKVAVNVTVDDLRCAVGFS